MSAIAGGCDVFSVEPDGGSESGANPDGEVLLEAPGLSARVEAGELPALADRLPTNPAVVHAETVGHYGGTLRMQLSGIINAHHARVTAAMDRLVRWDPAADGLSYGIGDLVPDLAEGFDANADGTEFIFYLREGTKWSDGEPFTARDLVFAQEVLSHPELYPSPDPRITPAGAEEIDELTVRFTFDEPYSLFVSHVATAHAWHLIRLPSHYLQQYHQDYNPDIDDVVREENASDWAQLFER